MKSPFPGMDPYLEQYWGDVHHGLITYARDQLQPQLPARLRARMEERVFVESDEIEHRAFYPDVHVIERGGAEQAVSLPEGDLPEGDLPEGDLPEGDIALEEPLVVHLHDEPVSQAYIEIVDAGTGNRVVTVIEFLSPSNKVPGEGQDLYLRKQRETRAAGVSLVEIDLTRRGYRVMLLPPERIPPKHRTTYQVCVLRGWANHKVEVYRAPLTRRLPRIRVPLRETDADVLLDLQALIDQCYQNGRYDDLDYGASPNPPLEPPEAAWADELFRGKGLK